MRKTLILLCNLILFVQFVFSQTRPLIVDRQINPDTIITTADTIDYPDFSDSTGTKQIRIPLSYNSYIKFTSNFGDAILKICYIYVDSVETNFQFLSTDLSKDIEINIIIKKSNYIVSLTYNAVNIDGERSLDIKNCEFVVNSDNFTSGNLIAGRLRLNFDGQIFDRDSGQIINIVGLCNGTFKERVKKK